MERLHRSPAPQPLSQPHTRQLDEPAPTPTAAASSRTSATIPSAMLHSPTSPTTSAPATSSSTSSATHRTQTSWPSPSARFPTTSATPSATPRPPIVAVPIEFPKLSCEIRCRRQLCRGQTPARANRICLRHQRDRASSSRAVALPAPHRPSVPIRQLALAFYQTYGSTEDFSSDAAAVSTFANIALPCAHSFRA